MVLLLLFFHLVFSLYDFVNGNKEMVGCFRRQLSLWRVSVFPLCVFEWCVYTTALGSNADLYSSCIGLSDRPALHGGTLRCLHVPFLMSRCRILHQNMMALHLPSTYSGAKKYLVSHQLCKFSHLKRWERPVIFIIGIPQLWETK